MLDLETQIRRYGEHLEELYPPATLEQVVDRLERPTRLRAPVGPLSPRRGVVVALVAALVVLVLVGAAALLVDRLGDPTPPVVTEPEPSPTTLPSPEAAETFSVEISLGTWTWTRIDGTAGEVEQMWLALAGPEPLEVEYPVEYPYPDDRYSEGLSWHAHGLAGFAQFGGTTTIVGSIGIEVDWEAAYDEMSASWDVDFGRLPVELLSVDGVKSGALVVSVSGVAGDTVALEFHDRETGALVFRLDEVAPVVAETFVAYPHAPYGGVWEAEVWLLFVDQGDGVGVWVEPPWQDLLVGSADVAVGPNGLVVAAWARPSSSSEEGTSLLHLWGSRDGVVWEELGSPISLDLEADHEVLDLVGGGDRLVMVLAGDMWTSTDGSDWRRVEANFGRVGWPRYLAPTNFGWAYVVFGEDGDGGSEACKVWVSPDGDTWERIPLAPSIEPEGAGAAGCRLVGDSVVAMHYSEGGTGSVWIGRLDQ
jgi:hypothetical protein